jgi:hypothetical protein
VKLSSSGSMIWRLMGDSWLKYLMRYLTHQRT